MYKNFIQTDILKEVIMKAFKRIFIGTLMFAVAHLSLFPIDLKVGMNFNTSYSSDFKDLYGDNTRGFDLALFPLKIGGKFKLGLHFSNFSADGELPITGNPTGLSYSRLGGVLHFLLLQNRGFTFFAEACGGIGRVKETNYLGDESKNAFYVSLGAGADYTLLKSQNVSLASGLGLYYNVSQVEMISKSEKKSLSYFTLNLFMRISLER
jgi:hypothetical protein